MPNTQYALTLSVQLARLPACASRSPWGARAHGDDAYVEVAQCVARVLGYA
jgi:hypothetical protein